MPAPRNDDLRAGAFSFRLVGAAVLSLGLLLPCSSCKKTETQTSAPEVQTPAAETKPPPPPSRHPDARKPDTTEGNAVWYNIPANSLAKRRAGKDELTAAHNRLPLGTMVRVTHLANGRSVIVRITDHGITKRRALIDLCKEAAEKLEMLSEGSARVRLEVLPDNKRTTAAPESKATAAQP